MFAEETYRLIVEVIEVQGLIWPAPASGTKPRLPNPFVDILVGTESQWTATREATSTCSFNRLFVFNDVGYDESVEARVFHKSFLGQELIGSYLTSVRAIRQTPAHRLSQTLCPLIIRERPSEPRGFIRLSIQALRRGEIMDTESISTGVHAPKSPGQKTRVLYAPELDFEAYYLHINIYFGQDILKTSDPPGVPPPSSRIQVQFSDAILTTQVAQATRGPTWCETLRFPATVPSACNKLSFELWTEADVTLRVSGMDISFDSILHSGIAPTWVNFYTDISRTSKKRGRATGGGALAAFTALFELEDEEEEPASLTGYHYLGRVLMTATSSKTKAPGPPQVFPCRPIERPPDQELVLWADLFEISGLSRYVDILVQVAFGDWLYSLQPTEVLVDTIGFKATAGRIPQEKFILPVNLDAAYDLILRVYGCPRTTSSVRGPGARRFIGYARISPSTLVRRSEKPEWIELTPADKAADLAEARGRRGRTSTSRTAAILASFLLRKASVLEKTERREPSSFSITRYTCSSCCYQAVHLPVLRSTLPSPHVVISLGGSSAVTQTLFHTVHPDWHEILSFVCTLPQELSFARDILVEVFSRDILLGQLKLPAKYLMTEEANKPQWYPLTSQRFPKSTARILCSFALTASSAIPKALSSEGLSKDDAGILREANGAVAPKEDYQYEDSAEDNLPLPFEVEYAPCDLRLFVIGCRMFPGAYDALTSADGKILSAGPEIQLEFGRNPNDLNSRLWYGTCDKVARGKDGNLDYFCPLEVKCFLPRSEIFQSFVELRVFQPCGEESRELGSAYLHLTPHVPWLPSRTRKLLHAGFGFFPAAMSELIPPPPRTLVAAAHFLAPILRNVYSERFQRHYDETDLEALLCSQEDTSTPPGDASAYSPETLPTHKINEPSPIEADTSIPDGLERSKLLSNANVFTSPTDVFFGKQPGALQRYLRHSRYLDVLENFAWLAVDDSMAEDEQEELHRSYESEMDFSELPYLVLPIIGPARRGTTPGEPDIVGLLKVRCHVFLADEDKSRENAATDNLHLNLRDAPKMKARVHVLSATGLVPKTGSGQPGEIEASEWYLVVKNANTSGLERHEIRDTKFSGTGFAPDFYRSFELDVEFPYNALLSVGVSSTGNLWASSVSVGRTLLDLENRWVYSGFKTLESAERSLPIETRILRNAANEEPTGAIRLWVELLTEEDAIKQPLVPVSLPPPEIIQVRVVVWQIKGIPAQETGPVSLYVVGIMAGTDDAIISQESDTHWNSSDGRGIFNWRYIFDVMVPSEAGQLRLQVWGRNMLAAHESIAETVIDLSADLTRCRTLKSRIHLERTWVKLTHPSNPTGVVGYMDVEIALVPQQDALDDPVGLGREKPNKDPFLPDVTENRSYISTTALAQSVFSASGKVVYGAKICSWIITFVVVITLYSIFSRFFFS